MTEEVTLGAQIRKIRTRRRMTLQGVSDDTIDPDTGRPTLTLGGLLRIENETRTNPKLLTLITLARALNIRITIDPDGVLMEDLEEDG